MNAPTTARTTSIAMLSFVVAVFVCVGTADAGSRAAEALALCHRADALQGDARDATLDRALEAAERAVAADDGDADAHFAVFCALGKQLRDQGFALTSLGKLKRAYAAVDRALALDPDHVPALIGKGAALIEAPAIAGGDAERGRALLRRALELDPDNMAAQLYLRQPGNDERVAVAQHAN
jgi:tetratricopeptide (TPR) repeat protein